MILVILSLFISGSFSGLQPEILAEWGVSGTESLQPPCGLEAGTPDIRFREVRSPLPVQSSREAVT